MYTWEFFANSTPYFYFHVVAIACSRCLALKEPPRDYRRAVTDALVLIGVEVTFKSSCASRFSGITSSFQSEALKPRNGPSVVCGEVGEDGTE